MTQNNTDQLDLSEQLISEISDPNLGYKLIGEIEVSAETTDAEINEWASSILARMLADAKK